MLCKHGDDGIFMGIAENNSQIEYDSIMIFSNEITMTNGLQFMAKPHSNWHPLHGIDMELCSQ